MIGFVASLPLNSFAVLLLLPHTRKGVPELNSEHVSYINNIRGLEVILSFIFSEKLETQLEIIRHKTFLAIYNLDTGVIRNRQRNEKI